MGMRVSLVASTDHVAEPMPFADTFRLFLQSRHQIIKEYKSCGGLCAYVAPPHNAAACTLTCHPSPARTCEFLYSPPPSMQVCGKPAGKCEQRQAGRSKGVCLRGLGPAQLCQKQQRATRCTLFFLTHTTPADEGDSLAHTSGCTPQKHVPKCKQKNTHTAGYRPSKREGCSSALGEAQAGDWPGYVRAGSMPRDVGPPCLPYQGGEQNIITTG